MKFISICSGIEAASVAFEPIGWEPVAFSEIEPFPCSLLKYRYPDVKNFGDMTKFKEWPEEIFIQADIIVGGPPCQSFSVAGKRNGLNDERGNLTLIYTELTDHADAIRLKYGKPPCVILYENVPGILSDKTGAFGCFLAELAGEPEELQPTGEKWSNAGLVLGPKRAISWRVFDAQYFGVAQRRRRVFVVASARTGFDPSEVLFEFDGLRRDTAPSRKTGQEASSAVGSGIEGASQHGFRMTAFGEYSDDETASTMKARDYKDATDLVAFNSRQDPVSGEVFGALDTGSPQAQAVAYGCTPTKLNGVANTITASYGQGGVDLETKPLLLLVNDHKELQAVERHAVATQMVVVFPLNSMSMLGRPSDDLKPSMGSGIGKPDDPQNTLTGNHHHAVAALGEATQVRRLTPIECERLMGFPDNHTQIPWGGKAAAECPDGHRYKALGNSWAVPVVRWIGERIQEHIMKDDHDGSH